MPAVVEELKRVEEEKPIEMLSAKDAADISSENVLTYFMYEIKSKASKGGTRACFQVDFLKTLQCDYDIVIDKLHDLGFGLKIVTKMNGWGKLRYLVVSW